jgi:PPOX class probable F420-dependent enzyme
MKSFLRRPIIALMAWVTPAGEPMMTPVWFEHEGGTFLIYTTPSTAKARAVARTGRVCLCVQYSSPPHRYVTVQGDAKIVRDQRRARRLREQLARKYLGRVGGRVFLRMAEERQDELVIIEITPTKIGSLDTASGIHPFALAVWAAARRLPGL